MAAARSDALGGIRRNVAWLTIAAVAGGALNFGYALALTWVLPVRQYPVYAGTQALLVVCGTAAAASAPWLLSQRLAPDRSPAEQRQAIAFAVALTGAQGLLAALLVAAIAAGLANGLWLLPPAAALSAFAIFAAATSSGYLQGRQRFGRLSLLMGGEVVIKVGSGLILVGLGAGATGVIAGIGLGALAVIAVAAPSMLRQLSAALRWVGDSELWRLLAGLAGIQIGVVLLVNLDLILGSALAPGSGALAGYQVSATLSRVPFYLASSLSAVVFTRLAARQERIEEVMGATLAAMIAVAVVSAATVGTLPLALVSTILPHGYPAEVESFIRFTAPAGALAALANLTTTFYQAAGRFKAGLLILAASLIFEVLACVVGLRTLGVLGLAYASLASQILTVAALVAAGARIWRAAVRPAPWPIGVAVAAIPLIYLRWVPAAWLFYAVLLGGAVAWVAILRGLRRGRPAAAAGGAPSVYLLTAGPVSPPWDGGDTNLARLLVSSGLPAEFTFLGQRGDATPLGPGRSRRELAFATGVPTWREQLRILGWLAREREPVDLVHLIITFGPSRLKEAALMGLPLVRRHPVMVTCPNGRHLPRRLLSRAEAVIALSRRTEERLRRLGLERVERIAPGVDLGRLVPNDAALAQSAMGLNPAPTLFFAGHYDPEGGLEAAIEALGRLRPDFPSLRLLTAMRGRPGGASEEERRRLDRLIQERGLADRVVNLGDAADIPLALQASRVVLYQPQSVGRKMDLPLVLLEALALGRPLLVSDVEALGELADRSLAVRVVAAGSEAADQHLRRLLSDDGFHAAACRAARRLAEERYDAEAMVHSYERLYHRLLSGEERRPANPAVEPVA